MIELRTDSQDFFKGKDAFDEILNLQGEIFRQHKNRKTLRITKDGKGYFIKIHRKVGWGEILKNLLNLRLPVLGAKNELRAIRKFEELGIETMKVVGYGERGLLPAWLDSFLITEELENTISLENFCKGWKSNPPDLNLKLFLILKIADIARRLHQNGINHRDFYICHFLLDLNSLREHNSLRVYLIDLHRVQMRKHTPQRWIIKDLSGLFFSSMDIGLTRRDLFRFMKAYSGKPLRTLLKDEQDFWNQVSKRAVTLYQKHFNCLPATQIS